MNFQFFCTILASLFAVYGAQDPIVQLPEGKIRGHILQSLEGKPYYAFQEIPYAAPPVGSNRFKPPKNPEPWTGILNTTENKVVCYQSSTPKYKILNVSEDCLFLNVYSPVAPGSSERLPVLVWIHGGGYGIGSGASPFYSPKYAIDEGIVVVTLNYRLGPFGFLTTDDDVMPANLGLKDQLFGIEWVNKNIELFGGNASRVTIDGQSAGSDAVGRQLLGPWPNGKVLFHAAIMQSGSSVYTTRSNNARETAFKLGKALDGSFSSNDSTALLELLQKVPAAKLLSGGRLSLAPIVEKSGPFSYQMYDVLETGNIKKVPVIIGFTSEESINSGARPNVKENAAALDKDTSKMIGQQFGISTVNRTIAGSLLKRIYTNTTFENNIGAFIRFSSDRFMSWCALKQADLESKYVDVYVYEFSHHGPLGGKMNLPYISGAERVGHAEDLEYFWADQSNAELSKFPEDDRLTSRRFIKLWTNFIKYHNPTPTEDPLLQNVKWTKIDPNQTDIQFLNINSTIQMQTNPRYHRQVKKVLDYYISAKNVI